MSTTDAPITAEHYAGIANSKQPTELVRGRIVEMNPPGSRHGQLCTTLCCMVGSYARQCQLGHFLMNDSGIITERNPDTVRGADAASYSYVKVPKGPLPAGYLDVPPDLVFEVVSPTDRLRDISDKVNEYLNSGVTAVCVLNDQLKTMQVFYAEQPCKTLSGDDQFVLPGILGDFCAPVRQFFE